MTQRLVEMPEPQLEHAERDHRPRLEHDHAQLRRDLAPLGRIRTALFRPALKAVEPREPGDRPRDPRELRGLTGDPLRVFVESASKRPPPGRESVTSEEEK